MSYKNDTIVRVARHSPSLISKMSGVGTATLYRLKRGLGSPNIETLDRINAAIDKLDAEKVK